MPIFGDYESDANAEGLEGEAEGVLDLMSRISGRNGDMNELFMGTAKNFSELIAQDLKDAASENRDAWENALTACLRAYGAIAQWASSVRLHELTIEGLREELATAEESHFGEDPADETAVAKARDTKEEELRDRAKTSWDALETSAAEQDVALGESNENHIRELVEAGIIGFGAFNVTENPEYDPEELFDVDAVVEEIPAFLGGEGSADSDVYAFMALMGGIMGRAALMQERGEGQLRDYETEMLRELFDGMEEEGTFDFLGQLDQIEGSDTERAEQLLEALGGGALVLSDESLGGGYAFLPESIRETVEGPYLESSPGSSGPTFEEWERSTGPLGALFGNAPENLSGGRTLSAHMTTTVGQLLNSEDDYLPLWAPDAQENMEIMFDVSTRNEDGNIVATTGEWPNGADYAHPNYGSVDPDEILPGIYKNDWSDDGASAARLTEWIIDYQESDDPEKNELAGHGAESVIEVVTSEEHFDDLANVGFFGDEPSVIDAETGEVVAGVGMINPEVSGAFFDIYNAYIDSFADGTRDDFENGDVPNEGVVSWGGADGEPQLELGVQEREKFLRLVAGNESMAHALQASSALYNLDQIGDFATADAEHHDVGSQAGVLQAIVDSAVQNEAENRFENAKDAAEELKSKRQFGVDLTASIIGAVDSPVSGPIGEIYKYNMKSSVDSGIHFEMDTPANSAGAAGRVYEELVFLGSAYQDGVVPEGDIKDSLLVGAGEGSRVLSPQEWGDSDASSGDLYVSLKQDQLEWGDGSQSDAHGRLDDYRNSRGVSYEDAMELLDMELSYGKPKEE